MPPSSNQSGMFLIMVIQICATYINSTSAFQLSTNVQQIRKCMNNGMSFRKHCHGLESFSCDDSESGLLHSNQGSIERRKVIKSLGLLFTTSVTISSASEAAKAETSTGGNIPDMVGGFKKPKGVGGLTKKIRKVGDIMVRCYYFVFCIIFTTVVNYTT